MKRLILFLLSACTFTPCPPAKAERPDTPAPRMLKKLKDPRILYGDPNTGYRDPLLVKEGNGFYLYYSYILGDTTGDKKVYWYIAYSKSKNLTRWSKPRIITPKDQRLNFGSPGDLNRIDGQWHLTVQTYPQPGMVRGAKVMFGNKNARVYFLKTADLDKWPEKSWEFVPIDGDKSFEQTPTMIDFCLCRDRLQEGKWWGFYKKSGSIYNSWTTDLKTWHPLNREIAKGSENPQVFIDDRGDYLMVCSPKDGMDIYRSKDMVDWELWQKDITLGKAQWPWAAERITAGYIADFRNVPGIGKYIMVFHGMPGPVGRRVDENVNANTSIGIAWSDDLIHWSWPGRK